MHCSRCARTGTRTPRTSSAMSCPADLTAFASGNGNRLKISCLTSTTTIWEAMTTLKRTFIVLDTTVPARICTDFRHSRPLAGRPHGGAAGQLGPGQATNIFAKGSCGTNKQRCKLSCAGILRARQLGTGPGLGSLSASAPNSQRCHLSLGTDFSKARPRRSQIRGYHRLKFSSSQREPFVV